jgi:hypothetical protein
VRRFLVAGAASTRRPRVASVGYVAVPSPFTITSTYGDVDVHATTTTSGGVRSANDPRTTLHAVTRAFVVSTRRHGR